MRLRLHRRATRQITGINFTLPRAARITPQLNQTTFGTGDTLVLALDVQNASPNAVNVRVVGTALVPGEPGINPDSFCCFQDSVTLFEQASVAIPALTSTVVPDVLSYQFNGSEPAGSYLVCVSLAQGRLTSQPCAQFNFTP